MNGILRRTSARLGVLVLIVGAALAGSGTPTMAADETLQVDVGTVVRPVTHVGAGGLYGVRSDTQPSTDMLQPLSPISFTQPPPGTQHLPNGETEPCCDVLDVSENLDRVGAQQFARLPDIYPTFPYQWQSWSDWEEKVTKMVEDRLARPDITNIHGWELWNEPDYTWDTEAAGAFHDGWTRTYDLVRSLDPVTPIVGPSWASYEHDKMLEFMRHAQDTDTLPDVIVWHELGDMGWESFGDRVADYRAIEDELGISPRPIAINEYNSYEQMDIPSVAVHWISVFERHDVREAHRAFWFEPGTFNGLWTLDNQPTASYWAYNWYGAMRGNIVATTPDTWLDGVASYDSDGQVVNVVFGGDSGDNTVQVDGLEAFGSEVDVQVLSTPGSGRDTHVPSPTTLLETTLPVTDGGVSVPVDGMTAEGAYQLLVTPTGGAASSWQQVYEAENATVVNAATFDSADASNGYYVGGLEGSGDMRSDSYVDFTVNVPEAGPYTMTIDYANGTGSVGTHGLAVDGGDWSTVTYEPTADWGQFAATSTTVELDAGYNVIRLAKGSPGFDGGTGYAELDGITLS